MQPQEFANTLTGATYRNVITREQAKVAKEAGLVVVYGQSDDLMEFDGAIYDEVGVYDGGIARVDTKGLLPDRESITEDDDLRDYFAREPNAVEIAALWAAEGGYSWTYSTTIPHATFEITEDGEPYCRGIVFKLADAVPSALEPQGMNTTTPTALPELARIGELIRTQNNRITDSPIFIVQQKRRVCGVEDDFAEGFMWYDARAVESYDEAGKAERDADREAEGLPPIEWQRGGYVDTWEFVTACFTEQGCKDFIARDGHNLREPRIYAAGSYRNEEWRTVRKHLMDGQQCRALGDGGRDAAFERAMKESWEMVQPTTAAPGSYYAGLNSGMAAALRTVRENYTRAIATGMRAATPDEEAEIDAAAGLYKLTLRIPITLADRLRDEALAADVILPAYVRQLLLATPAPPTPGPRVAGGEE